MIKDEVSHETWKIQKSFEIMENMQRDFTTNSTLYSMLF